MNIFELRKKNADHIALYYSKNQDNCLLMCKISGKFINLLLPALEINLRERSFIAVYG